MQKTEANESATEPVILQYHASENDRANCDVEILNGETSSHYSGPQFHNMLRAKFGTLQTQCLLDTGASISVCSEQFLHKIPAKFVKHLSNKFTTVYGVGHFQQKISSRVQLSFQINGTKFIESFYVFPNSHNIILGLPFLSHYNAILDMQKSQVVLQGQKFDLHPPSVRSSLAKISKNIIIPAYTAQDVKVRLNKPVISEYMSLTSIASIERIHPDLKIVEAIISNQNTFCRLVNKSQEPIPLSQGTAVALARTFPSMYVSEISDFYENSQQDSHDEQDLCTHCTEGQSNLQPQSEDQLPGRCVCSQREHALSSSLDPSHPQLGHSVSRSGLVVGQPHQSKQKQSQVGESHEAMANSNNIEHSLTKDHIDFSTDLQCLFGETPDQFSSVNEISLNASQKCEKCRFGNKNKDKPKLSTNHQLLQKLLIIQIPLTRNWNSASIQNFLLKKQLILKIFLVEIKRLLLLAERKLGLINCIHITWKQLMKNLFHLGTIKCLQNYRKFSTTRSKIYYIMVSLRHPLLRGDHP